MVLLVVLLNGVLFFNGCQQNNTLLTAGFFTPFVELMLVDPDWIPTTLIGIWPWAIVGNLAGLAVVLAAIDRGLPRLAACLASRRFLILLMLAVFTFNSFSYFPALWMNAVWAPTSWIVDGILWLMPASSEPASKALIAAVARLYLVLVLTFSFLLVSLIRWLCRKYLLVSPERWWQFNLAGLLALMLIFGAGIGLLVRWLTSSGE